MFGSTVQLVDFKRASPPPLCLPWTPPGCVFKEFCQISWLFSPCRQGQINHWANQANARGLALLVALRLNVKTLLYWFFMFLDCSPSVKIVEIFDYCV